MNEPKKWMPMGGRIRIQTSCIGITHHQELSVYNYKTSWDDKINKYLKVHNWVELYVKCR